MAKQKNRKSVPSKRPVDSEKLKQFIKDKGWNYPELVERIQKRFPNDGVALSTIEKIMVGQKSGAYVAWKIAKACNKPEDFFLKESA